MNYRKTATWALALGIACACSSGGGSEGTGAGGATTATEATAVVLDRFELESGAAITLELGPEGSIVTVGEGPEGTEAELDELARGVDGQAVGILDLYARLAPGQDVPEQVLSALEELDVRSQLVDGPTNLRGPAIEDRERQSPVDALALQNKEAPRNVASFRSNYCGRDNLNEAAVVDGFYRAADYCNTEKTDGFNLYTYDVKQGYVATYLYRGSATLRYYWQTTGAWTLGNSYPVAEGGYRWVSVTYGGRMNVRYELADAAGDGFNYVIHSARSDIGGMKSTVGNDFYHAYCQCTGYNALLEACAPNSSEQNARAAMNLQCERFGTAAGVQCQMRVFERMSNGVNCDARVSQQIRECTGISAAVGGPACRYECKEICRQIR